MRWDKSFLGALHLNLSPRRASFRVYGGVRFGGTVDADEAFAMGFDHVAIAAGAGKPTIIDVKHNLIRGVRKASDFLMALQLTGAAKRDSLASLQVRLPAIVIGGGLTGIDTTTEAAAYYPVQVSKFLRALGDAGGEAGRRRIARRPTTPKKRRSRASSSSTGGPCGRSGRGPRRREAPDFASLVAGSRSASSPCRSTPRCRPTWAIPTCSAATCRWTSPASRRPIAARRSKGSSRISIRPA